MKTKPVWYNAAVRGAIFIALIFLPFLTNFLVYTKMVSILHEYMEYQVAVQSASLGELASLRLSAQLENLERVANYFRDGKIGERNMGAAAEWLSESPDRVSCGVLRLDGTPVSGEALLPAEAPAVQDAFRGRSSVRYREGVGFLFVSPIYNGDNIKYALYEFWNETAVFPSFGESCYGGQGEIILSDRVQQKMIPIFQGEDLSYFCREDVQEAYTRLSQKMGSSTSAAVYCENGGRQDFLFVSELEQDNLYLLGRVPYHIVSENVSSLSLMVLLIFDLLLILLVISAFNMVVANAKARESSELREAKRIAEEASKSKSTFLANMSHELRTPISVILGMDEMILRGDPRADIKEHAMDIKSAAQILLGLINDILDFSKIESGKMNIVPVEYNLPVLIHDLVLLSESRAQQKSLNFKLEVQPDLPVGLYGDDLRIQQVLINLLTNAVKYTPQGSVLFKVEGTRRENDSILIHCEVTDSGIGIKQEDIDKLFIPYSRIEEKRNRNIEGTGLGIPIIINLLKLMGSQLKVRSVYGKGSTFYFDLEQKIVDPEPVGDIQKRMDDLVKDYKYKVSFTAPSAHILMVDDNSMNRKIFASLLRETQIPVTTVSSGKKALDLVQKEHFDLIFMDYLMPEMDGVETLRRFRELEDNLCRGTPVVALTANAFSGAKEKYMEAGFDGFLSKPIVTEKLEALIREMLPEEYIEAAPPEIPALSEGSRSGEKEPAVKGEEEFPPIEGVNWEFARLHIRDRDLLLHALQDFYENIDAECRDLPALAGEASTVDGLKNYRIRVHALKSTSATVGILSVSELAKLLESAAKVGETAKIRAVTPLLMEELLKAREQLQPFVGQQEAKPPLSDLSQLPDLFDMLRFSMEQMDIGGVDSVMNQIQSYSYAPDLQKSIDQLHAKTTSLDFDGAAEEIDRALEIVERFLH